MRTYFTALLLIFCLNLSGCCTACKRLKEQNEERIRISQGFSVNYNAAGLRQIIVRDGKLVRVQHTLKEKGMPVQSLDAYNKNQDSADLTKETAAELKEWFKRNKLDVLKKNYAPEDKNSYGAAFNYSLIIKDKKKQWNIRWTADSELPGNLQKAIAELHIFADKLIDKANQAK